MINLGVKIGKLKLKNPIILASGTAGYGEELQEFFPLSKLGAIVTKGISLKPRKGNPPPRIIETPSGMLNAIGLQNVGLDAFLKEKLPFLRRAGATTIVNVFGETEKEYAELAEKLSGQEGVSALELNVSCPNVKRGGLQFGSDPKTLGKLVDQTRKACDITLIVKLSPQVTDIVEMARVAFGCGADAVSLINTVPAMAIDAEAHRPVLANITGGLSGPAIKPIALRMVWEVSSKGEIPPSPPLLKGGGGGINERTSVRANERTIIGIGGIMNATDVVEFLLAGATAVQIGTANFVKPGVAIEIIEDLKGYLVRHRIKDVSQLIGIVANLR